MKLNSQLAGTRLSSFSTQISRRRTTNFAAALQDNNPLYFDDESGSQIAPPTFPVSVTWPVLSRLGDFIESRDFPKDVLLTQVHYTEHLILHRMVRPDDKLDLDGEIVSITPHRAGTHAVVCLAAKDKAGNPVFTEYIGAMLRGVECKDEGQSRPLPEWPKPEPYTSPAWTSTLTIDPLAPYLYDSGADIEFPIHTSPEFAKAVGLPGIILQGTATLGLAVRELVNNELGDDPEAIKEIACTFTGMVMPGTEIEICCLGVQDKENFSHLFFEVLNADNKKAIRNGFLKIKKAGK